MPDIEEYKRWAYDLIRGYTNDIADIAERAADRFKDQDGDVALRAFANALRSCGKDAPSQEQKH